eukprot:COSAG02_NODE_392_length_23227_cov_30.763620_15_plen_97_part_00
MQCLDYPNVERTNLSSGVAAVIVVALLRLFIHSICRRSLSTTSPACCSTSRSSQLVRAMLLSVCALVLRALLAGCPEQDKVFVCNQEHSLRLLCVV